MMKQKMTVVNVMDNKLKMEENMYPKLGVQDDLLLILHSITGVQLYKKSALLRIFIKTIQSFTASMIIISLLSIFYWKTSPIFMRLEYLPYLGVCSMGFASNLFMVMTNKQLIQIQRTVQEHGWCYKSGGSETYSRIFKSCTFIKIFHIFISVVLIGTILMSMAPLREDDKEWQAPLFLLDKYTGFWKPFYLIPYHIFMLLTVFSTTMNLNLVNYTICQITYQYHLLNHFVIRLVKFSKQNIDGEGYQDEIYEQIAIIIRMHTQIKKFCRLILVLSDCGTILLSLSAIGLFLCIVTFVIFDVHSESNFRFCLIAIPLVVISITYCSNGQQAVDESERVYYNALNCKWFNWNTKNRRAYHIFLTNNIKPMSFTRSGIIDVDLRLLMSISKIAYTLLTMFLNLKKEAIHN